MIEDKDAAPRMIEIGATCNNKCVFCCQYGLREQEDKTTAEIKEEIDLAKKDGNKKVSFLGGEFTVRPDAIELIAYAKGLGFDYIHITTNGRMFSYEDFAKKIIGAGLTVANFSVYGPNAKIHDALTGVEGSFKQTMDGLRNYLKYEHRVAASITVVKGNHNLVLDTVKILQSLGVSLFHINGPIPEGLAKENFKKVIPMYSDFIPHLKDVVSHCRKHNLFVRFTNIPICHFAEYKEYVDEVANQPISVMTDEGKVITEDEKRKGMKQKLKACRKCYYENICEGVFKEYVLQYGKDEFVPVKNTVG